MARVAHPAPLPRLRGAVAHAAAGLTVVATSVVLTAVLVIVFFVAGYALALLFDLPLGSPVAGPAWLMIGTIAAGVVSLSASLLILFPSTLAARALCSRVRVLRRFRPWTEIPVASVATLFLGGIAGALFDLYVADSPSTAGSLGSLLSRSVFGGVALGLPLLLPLGLYWWTLTTSRFGLGGVTKAGRAIQRRVTTRE